MCMKAGVDNVFAFDAGIFDWAKAYPNDAELLGKSPVDTRDILSKKQFKSRLLNPDKFSELATDDPSNVIILDIRDKAAGMAGRAVGRALDQSEQDG